MNKSKMYILVKEQLTPSQVAVATAHASLSCYLKFVTDANMIAWNRLSFRKIILRVNDEQFEQFKMMDKSVTHTESSLDNIETSIAFCPVLDGSAFKELNLY